MYVILGSADHDRRTIPLTIDARLVGEEAIAEGFGDPWLAVFRAIHEMDQVLHERLRHVSELSIVPPFQRT